MALIHCQECGHLKSDKAIHCPKCGIPSNQDENNLYQRKEEIDNVAITNVHQDDDENENGGCLGCISALITILIFIYCSFFLNPPDREDFAREYVSQYGGTISEVKYLITYELDYFPVPHIQYSIRYENGEIENVGYGFWGMVFITNSQPIKKQLYIF